jgi:hypothetical protein
LEKYAMIGAATPYVWLSPSYRLTSTGAPEPGRLAGSVVVGVAGGWVDGDEDEEVDVDDDVDGPAEGPDDVELVAFPLVQAARTSAAAHAMAEMRPVRPNTFTDNTLAS